MTLSLLHSEQLEARDLDVETCVELGFETSERSPQWLSIPYVRNGRVVNHKYRRIQKRDDGKLNFLQDPGGEKCLWNIDCLKDASLAHEPVVITEGEFDAVVALQNGWPRTVSVPEGAPHKPLGLDGGETKYSFLDEGTMALLAGAKQIILAVDGDEQGANLLQDLSVRLGRHRCKYLAYPAITSPSMRGIIGRDHPKDLNEVQVALGGAAVTQLLKSARWIRLDGIYRMSELPPSPRADVYDTGIPYLGKHFNIRLGDFSVLTGIPNHGKTTFANAVACQMALPMRESDEAAAAHGILPVVDYRLGEEMREDWGHGWTVALASFEQRPPDRDLKKALRRYRARRHPSMVPDAAMKLIDEWIDAHFALIVPSEDVEVSVEWMLEHLAAVFTQESARLAIVDPWNEMDHIRPRDLTLTEYTGFAIKAFKRLASKYQAHIMMVAHPTKMKANAQGELPCPTLYDISDSSHWANKSDAAIIVHRETNDRTMIKIQKTRYEEIGRPGKLYGTLLRGQGRFEIEVPESERGDVE
jgi:twinkle protein